jgi:hydrogenase expression/formation protein HypC
MCLGIPGKITEITDGLIRSCQVDFGGVVREACVETVPDAKVGDYVLVHAGFVLNVISEQEAQETLEMLEQLMAIDEELRLDATAPGGASPP